MDGTYIQGPAPRGLDRFVVEFLNQEGNVVAKTDEMGDALSLDDENLQVVVETGQLIRGIRAGEKYTTSK